MIILHTNHQLITPKPRMSTFTTNQLSKTNIKNPKLTWAQAVNNGSWRAQTRYLTDRVRITHDDFEELEMGPEARFKLKLAFLKREAKRGYKEKGTARNRTQINQILAKVKDEEELIYALNDLPENDLTLKLELVNLDHIPESQMYRIIRTKFLDLIEEFREDYFQACQERGDLYDDILGEKDHDAFMEKYIAIGREKNKSVKERTEIANYTIAAAAIANVRIVDDRAYFPGIKLNERIEEFKKHLPWLKDRRIHASKETVQEFIVQLLCDKQFQVSKKCTETFSFQPMAVGSSYMLVEVRFLELPNPRKKFERYFLCPGDEIRSWRPKGKKVGREVVDVGLKLGSTTTPPHTLILDRLTKNMMEDLRNDPEKINMELMLNKSVKVLAAMPPSEKRTKFLKVLQEDYQTYHEYVDMISRLLDQAQLMNPLTPLDNIRNMTCKVIYCQQHCHVCCTTEHPYKDYEKRGTWRNSKKWTKKDLLEVLLKAIEI